MLLARYRTLASQHPISATAGRSAARAWLADRGLSAPALMRWHANILLSPDAHVPDAAFDERTDSRFRIEIYSEEWGYFFCHRGRASWIRVTDVAFIHGRDDFQLLMLAPSPADLGPLLRHLEATHGLAFRRDHARIETNLAAAEPAIRRWVESL